MAGKTRSSNSRNSRTSRTSHTSRKAPPVKLAKPQRQHLIAKLIEQHRIQNQAQLVELLAGENVLATQATVSRDLDEMGAIKVRVQGGESAYALPELPKEQYAPEDHLRRVLGDWVVEVAYSGNMIVLRTPPGSAHVVGSALDRVGLPEILGTVAGDDTLMLVVAEGSPASEVSARLSELAGL
ncbi:MAG: arginine repressor [Actinobacteria bacterium]|nr:arginine repressor [Actinomycetota bacterium]